ncbi:MAG: hypothetical protein U0M60_02140 [Clostridia bacterium]|nr:hypothetical protein [Clostridia bacterium]
MNCEVRKYQKLNELAETNGIVVFGGREDMNIFLGELRQAFAIEQKMYNRSIAGLSVKDAVAVYDECVAPITPETVLIHIGEADRKFFEAHPSEFDNRYRELLSHIKSQNKKCRIAVVSLRNYESDPQIEEINKHLKYIADSEQCEYGDIASKKVWNPQSTRNTISFVYATGFVRPLKNKRPLYDLVKILFCCEA